MDTGQATKGPALLVMAKQPWPGRTKTRLSPPFTLEEAAELYECFLRDTLQLATSMTDVTPIIAYAPPEGASYFRTLAPHLFVLPQLGATLGERLNDVLTRSLKLGYRPVVAINSDSPTLPRAYLEMAFERLAQEDNDVVLGPCEDGGYYLIGWKQPHPRIVLELEMSTNRVLDETLGIAREEGLLVTLLPAWYDIDDASDLRRMASEIHTAAPFAKHTRRFLLNHDPKSTLTHPARSGTTGST